MITKHLPTNDIRVEILCDRQYIFESEAVFMKLTFSCALSPLHVCELVHRLCCLRRSFIGKNLTRKKFCFFGEGLYPDESSISNYIVNPSSSYTLLSPHTIYCIVQEKGIKNIPNLITIVYSLYFLEHIICAQYSTNTCDKAVFSTIYCEC